MPEPTKPGEIVQPKDPRFKTITRGPRKGQMVRTTRRERIERRRKNMAALEAERATFQQQPCGTNQASNHTSSRKWISPEILFAFAIVFVLCGISDAVFYAIGMGLRALSLGGLVLPLVFIDFLLWHARSKPKRYRKYLPFVWWL